ncbi:VTT domain-containing protein [Lipingzhangella sp. LS1_29]|uniref:VTT domain-containing protein n=1 Tax=Lipingzhangella rawalii TaxID=2055835 RepID=A0ABU2H9M6_9ACTN|nr:VTT domain-containing protein [Lipingzhangella rawalii]MDS1272018.1 VTT domain-containing protein [Lipingzhangella rawalii]
MSYMEFMQGWPLWGVYLSLLGIVFLRAQATYWLGRGVSLSLHRSRIATRLGAKLERAERAINRFGPPAVTVSFLTVGIQTAINFSAGAMQMRFGRYLVAMFLGCLAWAAIYSLGGMAVFAAWWSLFVTSPELAVSAVAVTVLVILGWIRWRRRNAGRSAAAQEATGHQETQAAIGP